jgi:hypothetical protein
MDLTTRYHEVRVNPADVWKTTFKTKFGLFEWKVMPFGLANAPATFMRLINDIFGYHMGRIVIIYLDDILIFSKLWETHLQHVCQVLEILIEYKLQVNEKKSYFGHRSVPYLGFLVDSEGIQPDPSCIKALKKCPPPSSSSELKSFIRGISFYRKFVLHFSQLARPLDQLFNHTSTFV